MKQSEAEAYLIKNANRGYPADRNDILAQYAEEKYEMGANGMRAPAYGKWLQEQVGRKVRSQTAEQERKKKLDTPEGKRIETGFLFAKELLNEARANTERLRVDLETKFKEKSTDNISMSEFIQRFRKAGISLDAIDTIIKGAYPKEHAALEKAGEVEQARNAEYDKREKARNEFLNS